MNDAVIIFGICTFFVALGTLLPLVNEGFGGSDVTSTDAEEFKDDIGEVAADSGSLSFWDVLVAIAGMFSWTFGAIWWPIEVLLLVPLRVVLYFVIARNIWIGGGA